MINEQDKRAIETMARCGLDIEALQSMFSKASKEEIEVIWKEVKSNEDDCTETNGVSINCS